MNFFCSSAGFNCVAIIDRSAYPNIKTDSRKMKADDTVSFGIVSLLEGASFLS
jgi:hypothetical protein